MWRGVFAVAMVKRSIVVNELLLPCRGRQPMKPNLIRSSDHKDHIAVCHEMIIATSDAPRCKMNPRFVCLAD